MKHAAAPVLLLSALLASCGDERAESPAVAPEANEPAGEYTTDSPSTSTDRPAAGVDQTPVAPDYLALPLAQSDDLGPCQRDTLPLTFPSLATVVLAGSIDSISDVVQIDPYDVTGLPATGRIVTLRVNSSIRNDAPGRLDETTQFFIVDGYAIAGARVELDPVDLSAFGDEQVMVAGYRSDPDVNGLAGVADFELLRVFAQRPDGSVMLGTRCEAQVNDVLRAMSDELGYPSGWDLLAAWVSDPSSDSFDATQESVLSPPDSESSAWFDMNPASRSLSPADVPEVVRAKLDVRGAFVNVSDLGDDFDVIYVRTESGVSSGVANTALGSVMPLYFVPGDDHLVEFVLGDPNDALRSLVVATFDLDEATDGGGVEISGSVRDGTAAVRALSWTDMARLLGTTEDALDQLRSDYLSVGDVAAPVDQ